MIIFRPGVDETRQMETGYWQNAYYRVSMLILEQINSNAISRTQEPTPYTEYNYIQGYYLFINLLTSRKTKNDTANTRRITHINYMYLIT